MKTQDQPSICDRPWKEILWLSHEITDEHDQTQTTEQFRLNNTPLRKTGVHVIQYGVQGTRGPVLSQSLSTIKDYTTGFGLTETKDEHDRAKLRERAKQERVKNLITPITLGQCKVPRFPQIWLIDLSPEFRSTFETYMQGLPAGTSPDTPSEAEELSQHFQFMSETHDALGLDLPMISSSSVNPYTLIPQMLARTGNGSRLTYAPDAIFLQRFAVQLPPLDSIANSLVALWTHSPLYQGKQLTLPEAIMRIYCSRIFLDNAKSALVHVWQESSSNSVYTGVANIFWALFDHRKYAREYSSITFSPQADQLDMDFQQSEEEKKEQATAGFKLARMILTSVPSGLDVLAAVFVIMLGNKVIVSPPKISITTSINLMWWWLQVDDNEWATALAKAGALGRIIGWCADILGGTCETPESDEEDPSNPETAIEAEEEKIQEEEMDLVPQSEKINNDERKNLELPFFDIGKSLDCCILMLHSSYMGSGRWKASKMKKEYRKVVGILLKRMNMVHTILGRLEKANLVLLEHQKQISDGRLESNESALHSHKLELDAVLQCVNAITARCRLLLTLISSPDPSEAKISLKTFVDVCQCPKITRWL